MIVQLVLGDLADAGGLEDRRVGEDDVDPPAAGGDDRVEPIDVLLLAHVTLHAGGVVAEFLDRGFEFGLPASGDEDVCTFLDESLGGGEADPGAAAGDDGRLTCQKCHLSCLSKFWTIRSITRDATRRRIYSCRLYPVGMRETISSAAAFSCAGLAPPLCRASWPRMNASSVPASACRILLGVDGSVTLRFLDAGDELVAPGRVRALDLLLDGVIGGAELRGALGHQAAAPSSYLRQAI